MYKNYFQGRTLIKCDISFKMDNSIKDEFIIAKPYSPEDLKKLESQYGCKYRSIYSKIQHIQVQSHLNIACAANRLGIF